jgi:hypothetical protein
MRLEKSAIRIENRVNLGYDVSPSTTIDASSGGAQGDVQDRSLLGDVDLVTSEHRLDPRSQARFLCQFDEQAKRVRCDAILGVVQEEAHILDRHPLAAREVASEQSRADEAFGPARKWVESARQALRSVNGAIAGPGQVFLPWLSPCSYSCRLNLRTRRITRRRRL